MTSRMLSKLWKDDAGMILSSEVVLVGTILVLGSIVGLGMVQRAVTNELSDVASAYGAKKSHHRDHGSDDYRTYDSSAVPELSGGY